MQVGDGSATSYNDANGYVEEGYSYGYDQTMREKKGCRIDTAPPGTHHTTSVDSCDAQDPDPMAEGIGLVTTSGSDEDGGLNNEYRDKPENNQRPTRTEGPKMRPPTNPKRHQSRNPQPAAAWQLVAAKSLRVHDNDLPNRQDRVGTTKQTTQVGERETKTSQKSERSERSERHERPMRPEKRPPAIPKGRQVSRTPAAAARPIAAITAIARAVSVPKQIFTASTGKHTKVEMTHAGERGPKRSSRSKRPSNLRASAPPNCPRRLQLLESPILRIRDSTVCYGRLDENQVVIENAGEKGCVSTKK